MLLSKAYAHFCVRPVLCAISRASDPSHFFLNVVFSMSLFFVQRTAWIAIGIKPFQSGLCPKSSGSRVRSFRLYRAKSRLVELL